MPPRPGTLHGHAKVAVVCLGNPLYGDDAAGLIVCRLINPPPGVRVVEAGQDASRAISLLASGYHVILVDAVQAPGVEPGTVIVLEGADAARHLHTPPGTHGLSPLGLPGVEARLTLVGIVVSRVGLGEPVSREAARGAVLAAQLITELLSGGGNRVEGSEDTRTRG